MTQDNFLKKSLAEWQDIPNDGSLDTFAKLTHLSPDKLNLTELGIMILPNNAMLAEGSKDKNLFCQTTKDVLVALRTASTPPLWKWRKWRLSPLDGMEQMSYLLTTRH